MEPVKIKTAENFIETYADFASFSPAPASPDELVYVHFIANKSIPAVLSHSEIPEQPGQSNMQIGSINEIFQQCSVLMTLESLKSLRDNIDLLFSQLEAQKSGGAKP